MRKGSGEFFTIKNVLDCTVHLVVRMVKYGRLKWAEHVVKMEEDSSGFKIRTGKPTGKIILGRPRLRWEDNIRMNLKEIAVNTRNWVDSLQDKDYWSALCDGGIELPGSIFHGVIS